MTLTLSSPAFQNGGLIPSKFTCDGENVSPELRIEGVSEGVKSLVLIMDDSDVPRVVRESQMFDHWVLFNIDPSTSVIPEGKTSGVCGANTRGEACYTGPCPPPQHEPTEHRYFFSLYALDTKLLLEERTPKEKVLAAIQNHILQKAEYMGRYERL